MKQLLWAREQFRRAASKAEEARSRRNLLSTVVWTWIAADLASQRHPGFFVSKDLESLLLDVARQLIHGQETLHTHAKPISSRRARFLHVMTKASAMGGHTHAAENWIKNASSGAVHSLVTTAQTEPLPDFLLSSVVATGGWYRNLASAQSDLLHRATLLRNIANDWADTVVLHVHPFDPLPIMSFGIAGGPPVVLYNHADHGFWLGASVVDLVADGRPSGERLTRRRRRIRNSKILPIPLSKPISMSRENARKRLGISGDMVVLLTAGSGHKYIPYDGYDFLSAMTKVLAKNPKAMLIATGPAWDKRWAKASARVGGRIRALGFQSNMDFCFACGDIYLPSFPVGGTTAMFEAGLRGIPVVGLDNPVVPTLCEADDISLRGLETHFSTLREYEECLDNLIRDPMLRKQRGTHIRERIGATHATPAWNDYLDEIMSSLPSEHDVRLPDITELEIEPADIFLADLEAIIAGYFTVTTSIVKQHMLYGVHFSRGEQLRAFPEFLRNVPIARRPLDLPLRIAGLFPNFRRRT